MNLVGVYYLRDQILFNVITFVASTLGILIFSYQENIYNIVLGFLTLIFNLIDGYFHCKQELDSFNDRIKIERKSLYLSQFVERLLPKHVRSLPFSSLNVYRSKSRSQNQGLNLAESIKM
jgi:hypothetical protein